MTTATTNIWKEATKTGHPAYTIPIAIASTAIMFGAWVAQLATINKNVPKYAEGGWIDGRSHSQGGTNIEAEGGEFVVRKDRASVFGDILESLNGDSMTQAWDTINGVQRKGNNIVLTTNSKRVEDLLSEILTVNKEAPKDFGDHIEFYYKGTKYRIKK